jgi:polysaccharide pyruvyl transferase WcaK-like protein
MVAYSNNLAENERKKATNVLLVGYNGANNTGAEARLIAVIDDVRNVFGSNAIITIPALNTRNLKRYIRESSNIRIIHLPTIFWPKLWRLARKSDLVMLVEGSTYIDTYTSGLLKAYLWATKCAKNANKACIAYAVDAGEMSLKNQKMTVKEANRTDLIITRTQGAAELLQRIGVNAPIKVTADTALIFKPDDGENNIIKNAWPDFKGDTVGFAMVDFYRLPVVMKLWGRSHDCYKWPFYYSTSKSRAISSEKLVKGFANQIDTLTEHRDYRIALLCMDQMDEDIACNVVNLVKHPDKVRIFSSRTYNASQITSGLRNLKLLITSRYHGAVLAMEAGIPTIAVGHDARLRELFNDMGLSDDLFLDYHRKDLFTELEKQIDRLLTSSKTVQDAVINCHRIYMERVKNNRELLRNFALGHGLGVNS